MEISKFFRPLQFLSSLPSEQGGAKPDGQPSTRGGGLMGSINKLESVSN